MHVYCFLYYILYMNLYTTTSKVPRRFPAPAGPAPAPALFGWLCLTGFGWMIALLASSRPLSPLGLFYTAAALFSVGLVGLLVAVPWARLSSIEKKSKTKDFFLKKNLGGASGRHALVADCRFFFPRSLRQASF